MTVLGKLMVLAFMKFSDIALHYLGPLNIRRLFIKLSGCIRPSAYLCQQQKKRAPMAHRAETFCIFSMRSSMRKGFGRKSIAPASRASFSTITSALAEMTLFLGVL